jgi:hypothetical protein
MRSAEAQGYIYSSRGRSSSLARSMVDHPAPPFAQGRVVQVPPRFPSEDDPVDLALTFGAVEPEVDPLEDGLDREEANLRRAGAQDWNALVSADLVFDARAHSDLMNSSQKYPTVPVCGLRARMGFVLRLVQPIDVFPKEVTPSK